MILNHNAMDKSIYYFLQLYFKQGCSPISLSLETVLLWFGAGMYWTDVFKRPLSIGSTSLAAGSSALWAAALCSYLTHITSLPGRCSLFTPHCPTFCSLAKREGKRERKSEREKGRDTSISAQVLENYSMNLSLSHTCTHTSRLCSTPLYMQVSGCSKETTVWDQESYSSVRHLNTERHSHRKGKEENVPSQSV